MQNKYEKLHFSFEKLNYAKVGQRRFQIISFKLHFYLKVVFEDSDGIAKLKSSCWSLKSKLRK